LATPAELLLMPAAGPLAGRLAAPIRTRRPRRPLLFAGRGRQLRRRRELQAVPTDGQIEIPQHESMNQDLDNPNQNPEARIEVPVV
jgi:hypothetical protein